MSGRAVKIRRPRPVEIEIRPTRSSGATSSSSSRCIRRGRARTRARWGAGEMLIAAGSRSSTPGVAVHSSGRTRRWRAVAEYPAGVIDPRREGRRERSQRPRARRALWGQARSGATIESRDVVSRGGSRFALAALPAAQQVIQMTSTRGDRAQPRRVRARRRCARHPGALLERLRALAPVRARRGRARSAGREIAASADQEPQSSILAPSVGASRSTPSSWRE